MKLIATLIVCTLLSASAYASDTLKARELEPNIVEAGRALYEKNCAICHGANGVGPQGDWRKRDSSGRLPPPPLNGSAHTWHHSNEQLIDVILKGSAAYGENMPAWEGKLTQDEIKSILSYVKSLWPDEVYEIWHQQWGQR